MFFSITAFYIYEGYQKTQKITYQENEVVSLTKGVTVRAELVLELFSAEASEITYKDLLEKIDESVKYNEKALQKLKELEIVISQDAVDFAEKYMGLLLKLQRTASAKVKNGFDVTYSSKKLQRIQSDLNGANEYTRNFYQKLLKEKLEDAKNYSDNYAALNYKFDALLNDYLNMVETRPELLRDSIVDKKLIIDVLIKNREIMGSVIDSQ